ncbi:MAG: IclR family transcriptional regulator [Rhizobiales bacterium]|jgi:DNA-binding IclR family transcriptional regulator|nr:IclR family transcriptional regulator [Hyphomicrobiales bacterium]
MADDYRNGIKAITAAARILEALADAQKPVALREIATSSRMAPSKAHRYLASFLATGLARQDADTRRYALGPLSMRLGLAALSSHQPLQDAIALQRKLRDQLDETFVLSVWSGQGPTVVHVEESSQSIVMTMRAGAVLPMLSSATGLVCAAFLPHHFTAPLTAKAFATQEAGVLARTPAAFEKLVKKVREQGFGYNKGHLMPGVSALAFPLFDRTGTLFSVMAVMGRDEKLNPRTGASTRAFLMDVIRRFNENH